MDTNKSTPRVIIITGANKGIGYAIVETLVKQSTPYVIILTARNPSLGNKAVEELQAKYPNSSSKLIFEQLDVSNEKSVANFADKVKTSYKKIDGLINNAGVYDGKGSTEDRLAALKTNTYGLINVTEKILPYLTTDGKVLHVSSSAGILNLHEKKVRSILGSSDLSEAQFHDLLDQAYEKVKEQKYTELGFSESVYAISKAFVNAYNRFILPKKLRGDQQTFTLCPGACATDMNQGPGTHSAEEGAVTPVWLLNLPWKKNDDLNARFFRDSQEISYYTDSFNLSALGFKVYDD